MVNWGYRFGTGAGLWWLFGLLCMVVLVVAVVWLFVTLVRGPRHPQVPLQPWQPTYGPPAAAAPPRPTPYEILRERLARGEITVEEYHLTLAALGPETPRPGSPQGPMPPPSS